MVPNFSTVPQRNFILKKKGNCFGMEEKNCPKLRVNFYRWGTGCLQNNFNSGDAAGLTPAASS